MMNFPYLIIWEDTVSISISVIFLEFWEDDGEITQEKSGEDGKSDIRGFSLTEFCSSREADLVGH